MSEEILEKAAEAGSHVVGGVGGVTIPTGEHMGIAGVTPAVTIPMSGDPGGGVLSPTQSARFIDYMWDAQVWSKSGRRIVMRANTAELNKIGVGERIIKRANQADGTYTNQGVEFSKIELTTTKIRLDWEVATEALEDNIEGAALEDHIARLMATQFGQDLEDLAINATATGGTAGFHDIFGKDGFLAQYVTGNAARVVEWPSGGPPQIETFQDMILAMPRKFRGIRNDLQFYASTTAFAKAVNNLGTTAGGAFTSEALRERVVDGVAPQTLGAPVRYRVLGVPLLEVPLLGDQDADVILLTFPQNNIWGFQRDVTVHREFKPKKDTTEYTTYVRFGIAIEETNASAVAFEATP